MLVVCRYLGLCMISLFVFFFFKQKTAYEMRISDWSSDVCSSDLLRLLLAVQRLVLSDQQLAHHLADLAAELGRRHLVDDREVDHVEKLLMQRYLQLGVAGEFALLDVVQLERRRHRGRCQSGRAAGRGRGGRDV